MKPRFSLLAAAALSFALCAPAQGMTIAPGGTYSQNFNGIGTSATATLPSGWTVTNSTSARAVTQDLYETAVSATSVAGTGTGTGNGIYNWGDAADTSNRAVGFLASGTATKTGNLYLTLTASGAIRDFTVSYDTKCFRNNSNQFQFQLYYSTNAGVTWSSAGSSFLTTYATGNSGVMNPAGVTSVSAQTLSISLSSGDTVILCWNYSVPSGSTTSNAQGLGIDNVVIKANPPRLATPANLDLDGDAGANDFTVAWASVANAQGYSVKLLDANDALVDSNDVASATTTASFTGLTSSSEYTVVVVALGNHTTTDDSVAATLTVETAASAAAAPTLVVVNTSWTAGVAGTSAVSATLEGNIACTVETVSMSDGSTATVANGVLSWTPPASNLASSVTATFHITHGTDGWDLAQVLSVAATPAPAAPAISFDIVSRRSFDASWSSSGGGPVVSYKIRAWTGRSTPDDATGGASENFSNYVATAVVPNGWTFDHAEAYTGSTYTAYPVGFKGVSGTAVSPDFGGILTSLSFRLRSVSAEGEFIVYAAPSGSDDWTVIANYTSEAGTLKTEAKTVSLNAGDGYSKIKFEFVRTGGSAAFGTFVVSGVNWPAADFLAGWGGAKVSVGAATSQRFSNPVAGTANYVEVTAIGPSGLATTARSSVNIPHAPGGVISVK